jgi:hypothetical protein
MLRQIQGMHGTMRAVLLRNNQPLAAMQHQGRLLSMWSEIVYDDHGYGLSCSSGLSGGCVLTDGASEPVLSIKGGELAQIALRRPVALPLLTMVTVRVMEERTWAGGVVEAGS